MYLNIKSVNWLAIYDIIIYTSNTAGSGLCIQCRLGLEYLTV